jgi:peroxisomal enoyl-CoA hydratase 2
MADHPQTLFVEGWTATRCLARDLSRADIARYAGASGDVNLLHVDEPFARAAGHPAVLAHGMLTMGLTGSYLTELVGHDAVRRFGGRFVTPVFAGDTLECRATALSVSPSTTGTEVVLDLRTSNGDGVTVFIAEALTVLTAGTER